LVVIFILGVLSAGILSSLVTGEFSNSVSSARIDLQSKMRRAMEMIVKDVRQTNLIQINTNTPSVDYIKFKKVTGIDDDTGSYTLSEDYIEYKYDSDLKTLTRNIVSDSGAVLASLVFDNITEEPFYTETGVPLVAGGILTSKKLIIVLSGQSRVRGALTLNLSLTEEVRIRNA